MLKFYVYSNKKGRRSQALHFLSYHSDNFRFIFGSNLRQISKNHILAHFRPLYQKSQQFIFAILYKIGANR